MRVYVEAYGCAQNLGEAEELREVALAEGHELASGPEGADLGILVTCAVIGSTEERMVQRWRALTRAVPHTIVTGCMVPLREGRLAEGTGGATHLLPLRAQRGLPELLRSLERGGPGAALPLREGRTRPSSVDVERSATLPMLGAPSPLRTTVHRELVLAQGCTSHCSYCFSRLARGPLKSTPFEELRGRALAALRGGAVELRLSSLDTSCWGSERPEGGPRLPQLVEELSSLPSEHDYRLRVGMMSPQSLEAIAPAYFAALARLPRLFRFLHLPVQSGSDRVLEGMRRGYTVGAFRRLVDHARELVPDLTLSTDVIVGFPVEEREDHEATLRLLEEVEPEILNVTRFSPRPMTPAARLRPLLTRTVKERSREITALRLRLARSRMERWVGRELPAVVTEHGPEGTSVGRLPNYLPVVLPERWPLGSWTRVVVHGARSTYLLGEAVEPPTRAAASA